MPKSFEHDGGSTLGGLYLKRVVFGRVLVGFKYGISRVLQSGIILDHVLQKVLKGPTFFSVMAPTLMILAAFVNVPFRRPLFRCRVHNGSNRSDLPFGLKSIKGLGIGHTQGSVFTSRATLERNSSSVYSIDVCSRR